MPEARPAPFRPRARAELAALERALDNMAADAIAEVDSIAGDLTVNPYHVADATEGLRHLIALLEDLEAHARASRKKAPPKAKKKAAKQAA